jgi:hypothetical protein
MEVAMKNIQSRVIDAPASTVGALLDRIASDDDPIWPAPAWPPIRLDNALRPGSRGGHGPIRYTVVAYEPGRLIRFAFDPVMRTTGYHEFRAEPVDAGRTRVVHVLTGTPRPGTWLRWIVAIRWLHEALLRDLLDNVEQAATGSALPRRRWTPWVRVVRRVIRPRKATVDNQMTLPQKPA